MEIIGPPTPNQLLLNSMQDVSGQYGRDVEETFSQWQRDKEVAESFGLKLSFEPFGAPESSKGIEVNTDVIE